MIKYAPSNLIVGATPSVDCRGRIETLYVVSDLPIKKNILVDVLILNFLILHFKGTNFIIDISLTG